MDSPAKTPLAGPDQSPESAVAGGAWRLRRTTRGRTEFNPAEVDPWCGQPRLGRLDQESQRPAFAVSAVVRRHGTGSAFMCDGRERRKRLLCLRSREPNANGPVIVHGSVTVDPTDVVGAGRGSGDESGTAEAAPFPDPAVLPGGSAEPHATRYREVHGVSTVVVPNIGERVDRRCCRSGVRPGGSTPDRGRDERQ